MMQTGEIKVMTAKVRQFIEIEEKEALVGTIKFGRSAIELEKSGGRFTRRPNFAVPGPCTERPISADGRVAFHFKHSFVVKKARYPGSTSLDSATLVVSGDRESYSTDAADHERYISREAAVMAISPGSYDEYIGVGGLVGETAAIFTNIHPDLQRRFEFWNAVTRCERTPSPDVVKLRIDRLSGEQWHSLFSDHEPNRPIGRLACLYAEAIGRAGGLVQTTIECELDFREFVNLRKQLREAGAWDSKNPPITIKRGRGGRVQRRIVAEFPLGLDAAARIRITGKYTTWLGKRGIMYSAVIHEPDHHNDNRNFHLHIAAYDRPSRYLEKYKCWDFEYREEVPGQYKRFRYPMRQKKVADLTRPSDGRAFRQHGAALLTEMREKFASLCNEELKHAGINRLFDHRSYVEMGIRQEPQRHLGTKAASLEAAGIPTALGVENAERSWQGAFDRAFANHETRQRLRADCRAHAGEALDRLLSSGAVSPLIGDLNNLLGEFGRLQGELGDRELDIAQLYLTLQMAYSRSDKTADVCERLLDAVENGNASQADKDSEGEIRDRLREAEQHQERLHGATADVIVRAEEIAEALIRKAKKLDVTMKAMREAIDLTDELLIPSERALPTTTSAPRDVPAAKTRSRYSRELAAYFDAPLDYEEEWDLVFARVQFQELEIKPPSAQTPHYHVPGIAKVDLGRLMNPIFKERSQARLQAMYHFQELNRAREMARAMAPVTTVPKEPETTTKTSRVEQEAVRVPILGDVAVDSGPAEQSSPLEKAVTVQCPDERFERLRHGAVARRDRDQASAVHEWGEWFRAEYVGVPLPARFENGKLTLELEKLPADRRQIADVFSDEVTAIVMEELNGSREVLRNILLGASRVLVQIEADTAVYDRRDFDPGVQHHLDLLLQGDPVVRGYIGEALAELAGRQPTTADEATEHAVAAPVASQDRSVAIEPVGVVEQAWHVTQKGQGR